MANKLLEDDVQVIKAVLLYIISRSSEMHRDVYSIVKTAYYAQQTRLVKYLSPMFEDSIIALKFGPVPSGIYNILKLARGEERERAYLRESGLDTVSDSIGFESESFYAKEEPDLDYLAPIDIECLDEAIAKVAAMNFSKIKNDTHGKEWRRAWNSTSPTKTMSYLNIARDGGASKEEVEYLREKFEIHSYFLR